MRPLTVAAALVALACTGCATAMTGTPETISPNSAGVVGKVVSNTGGNVEYWVQYGPTQTYGSETAHQTVSAAQNTLVTVRVTIPGLQRATSYHYRLCAQDSQQQGGPGCSADQRFTTQSAGCGETVTTDVKLTGDLDCPQAAGFVIGADGVDVNLAGQGMFGGISSGGGGPRGIDNTGGYDDLTIRNGSIGGFGSPVEINGASRNRILDVVTGGANTAITIVGGADNEIRHNDAFGRSFGIRVQDSLRVIVADTSAGAGFSWPLAIGGDSARIVRNDVVNSFAGTSSIGISLTGANGRVADNRVDGPYTLGGISIDGPNNVVVENTATGAALFPGLPGEAVGDGIFVVNGSAGTVLRGNRADGNEGDGIQVASAGVRLEDNAAFSNGDFGIDGVAGVIDLGGNTAGGNGNPQQCRNVFCP